MQTTIYWSLWILVWVNTVTFAEQIEGTACDSSYGSEVTQQIEILERKLSRVQSMFRVKAQDGQIETKESKIWKGNQSTLGLFKRLSNDAKQKLLEFRLENSQDLDVSLLLDELKPCTNLESLKLLHVELVGKFPNTSATRLTLPRLHDYEIILDNFPDINYGPQFDSIFVQKKILDRDFKFKQLFELQSNIKVIILGRTKLLIDQDFGELIIAENSGIQIPKSFKCKKLTVGSTVALDTLQIPSDLTYLNAYIKQVDVIFRPRTEFNDLVKSLRKLKSLHMGVDFDSKFDTHMDFSDLPSTLEHVSFGYLRVNKNNNSATPSVHYVKTILFDRCVIDDELVDTMHMYFRNLEKLAIILNFDTSSQRQCHNFLFSLVTGDTYLRKLETIFVARCDRHIGVGSANKPKRYDEMEEFLTNMGLGKSGRFFLHRQKGNTGDWVWSGRNATERDEKLVVYELTDIHKLKTWETYYKDY